MTLEDKLCGFIVAIRQDIPWAYMVPIEPVLEDIKRKLGTDDVRLPKASEIGSSATALPASNTKMLTELKNDGQTPISAGEQFTTYTAESESSRKPQGFSSSRYSAELLSGMDDNLPKELPDDSDSLKEKSYLSNQQEDGTMNEKSSMLGSAPESPMVQQSARRPDLPSNTTEASRPATGPHLSITLRPHTVNYDSRLSHIPEDRLSRSVSSPESTVQPGVMDIEVQSSLPERVTFKHALYRVCIPLSIMLRGAVTAPYILWRRLEILILRAEYRRRLPNGRKHRPRPFFGLTCILTWPLHPRVYYPRYHLPDFQSAVYQDIQIFLYYLRLPFYAFLDFLLNILYFIACFPLMLLVSYRHRDVLEDEETLRRQRSESIEMLGSLAHDEYGDLRPPYYPAMNFRS